MPVQFMCGGDGLDGQSSSRSPWRGDPAVPVSTETHAVPWSLPSRAGGGCCRPRSPASGIAYLACPAARRALDCRSRPMWGPAPQQCIERKAYRRRLRSTSSVAGSDVGAPIGGCRYGTYAVITGSGTRRTTPEARRGCRDVSPKRFRRHMRARRSGSEYAPHSRGWVKSRSRYAQQVTRASGCARREPGCQPSRHRQSRHDS